MKIAEDLLHYLWAHRLFEHKGLTTTDGQLVEVINPGLHNDNAGPDFLHSHLIIDGICWYGHVELHVKAGDWYTHGHEKDSAYESVILHVIWENNLQICRGTKKMPTLMLKNRITMEALNTFKKLASPFDEVTSKGWNDRISCSLKQRLEKKSTFVHKLFYQSGNDVENTAYQLLFYYFGFNVNNDACLHLSQLVPRNLVRKNASNPFFLEALLLGQAGLLPNHKTLPQGYLHELSSTHAYLSHKYNLHRPMRSVAWRLCRLRPANFPFIRLAQLAQILHQHASVFHTLINTPLATLRTILKVTQSHYWQAHYQPEKKSTQPIPGLGKESIDTLIINTVAPLLVAYGKIRNSTYYKNKAMELLAALPPENNKIIRHWKKTGKSIKTAFDSQGALELYHNITTFQLRA